MKAFANRNVRGLLAGLLAVFALSAVPAGASAASTIEGVWSFNGGEVAVQQQPDGTFLGTVVAPTKFGTCYHQVGEQMWTQMTLQADGSYWGLHQWFYENAGCAANPTLGKTAWRVLEQGNSRFLRVCFSSPASAALPEPPQPTIAADGSAAGSTFGCSDSALISELPAVNQTTASQFVPLPPATTCSARPQLILRLVEPSGDPFAKVAVTLKSGGVKRRAKLTQLKGAVKAVLNLRGLTEPTFKVRAAAKTVLGHAITAKRTYQRCSVPGKTKVRGHR